MTADHAPTMRRPCADHALTPSPLYPPTRSAWSAALEAAYRLAEAQDRAPMSGGRRTTFASQRWEEKLAHDHAGARRCAGAGRGGVAGASKKHSRRECFRSGQVAHPSKRHLRGAADSRR